MRRRAQPQLQHGRATPRQPCVERFRCGQPRAVDPRRRCFAAATSRSCQSAHRRRAPAHWLRWWSFRRHGRRMAPDSPRHAAARPAATHATAQGAARAAATRAERPQCWRRERMNRGTSLDVPSPAPFSAHLFSSLFPPPLAHCARSCSAGTRRRNAAGTQSVCGWGPTEGRPKRRVAFALYERTKHASCTFLRCVFVFVARVFRPSGHRLARPLPVWGHVCSTNAFASAQLSG
mmetsp:Transcript_21967/g.68168  ORF Transcript_21967/g.68168 Transcript_21967/m.68168 type:complete len:234 (+) Transcript_21967:366-1067(+)